MSLAERKEGQQRQAFRNITTACDFHRVFPERVFAGAWRGFLFFQSDYIFAPEFTDLVRELLRTEHAYVACLLNIDRTEVPEFESAAAIFIDESLDRAIFGELLRGRGPVDGWLYTVDRYACSSDGGEWCIYCEKGNDVGVIGFREPDGSRKFEAALNQLRAKPIEDLIAGGCSPQIPFDRLVPTWCEGLLENYGYASGKGKNRRKGINVTR